MTHEIDGHECCFSCAHIAGKWCIVLKFAVAWGVIRELAHSLVTW